MFYGCKFTIIFRHSIHFCTKTAKTWAGTRPDILYHLGFPLFISLHYYVTEAPACRNGSTGQKGERHGRKGDKALGNRGKGTELPDSGGRPHL